MKFKFKKVKLTKAKKTILIIVAVVVVALAITLPLVLKRKSKPGITTTSPETTTTSPETTTTKPRTTTTKPRTTTTKPGTTTTKPGITPEEILQKYEVLDDKETNYYKTPYIFRLLKGGYELSFFKNYIVNVDPNNYNKYVSYFNSENDFIKNVLLHVYGNKKCSESRLSNELNCSVYINNLK